MRVLTIIDEDFANFKEPAMFIGTVKCGGKCCTEAGLPLSVCQNDEWRGKVPTYMKEDEVVERYLSNPITKAIVFGGLEPFEQFNDINNFLCVLRKHYNCVDPVVIYTGYNKDEIKDRIDWLSEDYPNIIVKFGRYVPGQQPHYDPALGVELASDNQYAEVIS